MENKTMTDKLSLILKSAASDIETLETLKTKYEILNDESSVKYYADRLEKTTTEYNLFKSKLDELQNV